MREDQHDEKMAVADSPFMFLLASHSEAAHQLTVKVTQFRSRLLFLIEQSKRSLLPPTVLPPFPFLAHPKNGGGNSVRGRLNLRFIRHSVGRKRTYKNSKPISSECTL